MKRRPYEQLDEPGNRRGAALIGLLVKVAVLGLVGLLVAGAFGYLTFFSTSHHDHPDSMFSMYGDLTPASATDITLHAAGLDHSAEYTVDEAGLKRFAQGGFKGYEGPEALDRGTFEKYYEGPDGVDWVWHEDMIRYRMWMARGTSHSVIFDPRTGRAFQYSAHW
jgi:hypothetical protein